MANPRFSVLGYLNRLVGLPAEAELTDGELLERCRGGQNAGAFEALMRRHGPLVWGVCRRVAPDAQDAEDAFQATFLVLLRKAGSLAALSSLASWLYGVAYHVSLKANTAAARRRRRERQVAVMASAAVFEESNWEEVRPLLDAELLRLPEKYRAPLVLCYFEGKTNEQAARELGWPPGSISKKLARGRELLRERLAARGVALSAAALTTTLVENAATAAPPAALADLTASAFRMAAVEGTAVGIASINVSYLAEGVLRTMFLAKLKLLALSAALCVAAASFSLLLAQQPAVPDDSPPPALAAAGLADKVEPAKLDLTPQNFAKVHALVRPQDNEWRHLKVQWLTDVVAARKKAAAEDKPLVICYTGGAGYNEPLGVC